MRYLTVHSYQRHFPTSQCIFLNFVFMDLLDVRYKMNGGKENVLDNPKIFLCLKELESVFFHGNKRKKKQTNEEKGSTPDSINQSTAGS